MSTAVLQAHYDGKQVVIDEPFELPKNAPLIVTLLAPDKEREDWHALSVRNLARAYGEDEPEYTDADLRSE